MRTLHQDPPQLYDAEQDNVSEFQFSHLYTGIVIPSIQNEIKLCICNDIRVTKI